MALLLGTPGFLPGPATSRVVAACSKLECYTFPQRIYYSRGASAHGLGLAIATIAVSTGESKWQQYGSRMLTTMIAELESIQVLPRLAAAFSELAVPITCCCRGTSHRTLCIAGMRQVVSVPSSLTAPISPCTAPWLGGCQHRWSRRWSVPLPGG